MHSPELLILDEPSIGLDPIIQRELRQIIHEHAESGNTVVLSSHVLSDLESSCSRIALINRGKLIRVGSLSELRDEQILQLKITFTNELAELGAVDIDAENKTVWLQTRGKIDSLFKFLNNYSIDSLEIRQPSLEEEFFHEVQDK